MTRHKTCRDTQPRSTSRSLESETCLRHAGFCDDIAEDLSFETGGRDRASRANARSVALLTSWRFLDSRSRARASAMAQHTSRAEEMAADGHGSLTLPPPLACPNLLLSLANFSPFPSVNQSFGPQPWARPPLNRSDIPHLARFAPFQSRCFWPNASTMDHRPMFFSHGPLRTARLWARRRNLVDPPQRTSVPHRRALQRPAFNGQGGWQWLCCKTTQIPARVRCPMAASIHAQSVPIGRYSLQLLGPTPSGARRSLQTAENSLPVPLQQPAGQQG